MDVKEPTSAPPVPVKLKLPPVAGIAPAGKVATRFPLKAGSDLRFTDNPPGPVRLIAPGSIPVTPGMGAGPVRMQPPGETEFGGSYESPVYFTKAAAAEYSILRTPALFCVFGKMSDTRPALRVNPPPD